MESEFSPEYPMADVNELLTVAEVDWSKYELKYVTCINHLLSRYSTKHWFERSLHYLQGPEGCSSMFEPECECQGSDLRVIASKER